MIGGLASMSRREWVVILGEDKEGERERVATVERVTGKIAPVCR